MTLKPDTPHPVLWLYIAQARLGLQTAITNLEATGIKSTEWPYPIIEMFLGRRTEQATVEAAGSLGEQLCEAQFFIAELLLLREKHTDAIGGLRSAVDTCSKASIILPSAKAELKRITR